MLAGHVNHDLARHLHRAGVLFDVLDEALHGVGQVVMINQWQRARQPIMASANATCRLNQRVGGVSSSAGGPWRGSVRVWGKQNTRVFSMDSVRAKARTESTSVGAPRPTLPQYSVRTLTN